MKKILLIEDEDVMCEAIEYSLSREGFEVRRASNGIEGLQMFRSDPPDLVLLDLMLPELDGFEVCREIRKESAVPILMITAKDSEVDEIVGLEIGADDYVRKPFNMRALIARIKALLRRGEREVKDTEAPVVAGEIELNPDRQELNVRGRRVTLTPMEYKVIEYLMRNAGKTVSREVLLNHMWGGSFFGVPKTLDVHIRHLREKIERDASNPEYLKTVRGFGYRFEPPQR